MLTHHWHVCSSLQQITLREAPAPRVAAMGDDSEWMKLPVDQKCEHKVAAGMLVFVFLCFLSFLREGVDPALLDCHQAWWLLHCQAC